MATTAQTNSDSCGEAHPNFGGEGFLSKEEFCKDLEKRGLLRILSSDEPDKLGFTFDWYRHRGD